MAGDVGAGAVGEPARVAGRARADRVELDVMAPQGPGHGSRHIERGLSGGGDCGDRGRCGIGITTAGHPGRHRPELDPPELVALGADARPEHRGPDAVTTIDDQADGNVEHAGGQPLPARMDGHERSFVAAQHDRRTITGPDRQVGVDRGRHDHVGRGEITGARGRSRPCRVGVEHPDTVFLVDHRPRRPGECALALDLRWTPERFGRTHVAVDRIGGDDREHASAHRTPEEFVHRDDRAPISGRTERRSRRRRRDRADRARRRRRTAR